jgi:hypothetical protein
MESRFTVLVQRILVGLRPLVAPRLFVCRSTTVWVAAQAKTKLEWATQTFASLYE